MQLPYYACYKDKIRDILCQNLIVVNKYENNSMDKCNYDYSYYSDKTIMDDENDMESPIYSIFDTARTLNHNLCIICQKRKGSKDKLSVLTDTGKETLLKYAGLRKELYDTDFAAAILRIEHILTNSEEKFMYHRECYSYFASSSRLERLRNKSVPSQEAGCAAAEPTPSRHLKRAQMGCVDINKCIVCQSENKNPLKLVTSDSMNMTIRELSNYDQQLFIRIVGIPCLIKSKVKYHGLCILNAKKSQKKGQMDFGDSDLPMIQICKELKVSASLGHVLKLSDVWERYIHLARKIDAEIPKSFESRFSTFKAKLQNVIRDSFHFTLSQDLTECQTLLIPRKFSAKVTADVAIGEIDQNVPVPIPREVLDDNSQTLVHAALLLRGELHDSPGHSGLHVSLEEAAAVIPKNLLFFLSVLLGGDEVLDDVVDKQDDDSSNEEEDKSVQLCLSPKNIKLSIGQDIVYAVSGGKKLTPKHIGLALSVHQQTRSRKLVTLLHSAGHCMSYKQVLQADKALANVTLKSLDKATGAVIPPNFKVATTDGSNEPALHITADNIDILTDTLDGKKTFHATQMVAFQRGGRSTDEVLRTVKLDPNSTLMVPDELNQLLPPKISKVRPEPHFAKPVEVDWFRVSEPGDIANLPLCIQESRLQDMAFGMSRVYNTIKLGWTEFNKKTSGSTYDVSAIGYMPLILNPAHEMATLNTVVRRCIATADILGKRYVILTTDQALYCKLLELKWCSEEVQSRVILRMGGLHLAMNFLKVIGKHMTGSGLSEMWLESGLMGEGSISKVLDGKAYGKGMRAHKITFQAMWQILAPQIAFFFEDHGVDPVEFMRISEDPLQLKCFLQSEKNLQLLSGFIKEKTKDSPNFEFWWSYMDMVLTLLMFTRGIRDGKWHTYRAALTEMLPFIARYDHGNYFRSLTAYICDMNLLPAEVEEEFLNGDFAVLRSPQKFAQVDPDHAQEWVVGISKGAGGLVGITQDVSTVQRWALSFHWRGEVTQQTFNMYGLGLSKTGWGEELGRRKRDNSDEDALLRVMQSFNLIDSTPPSSYVCNVATKDRATKEIQASLLEAKKRGSELVINFVNQRLVLQDSSGKPVKSFHATIPKNFALTLSNLFKVKDTKDRKKSVEADRDVLRRLIVAYEAGRQIDLPSILKHELLPVPLSLAEMNGTLRSSEKASVVKLVTEGVECPNSIEIDRNTSQLIIDGQALVNSIGKPANVTTFGDLAAIFIVRIVHLGRPFARVDVLFDRYRPMSIKNGTRCRRTRGAAPVRRVITSAAVPLPKAWKNFIALGENKADLARFLSEELLQHDFGAVEVIVSGGFTHEEDVRSTNPESVVSALAATHEEADTRVILHAVHSDADNIVVMARDSDILLLLIHHFDKISSSKVWMMTGTAKERKYIPVHEICNILPSAQKKNILAFHAVTGCDSTSHLATITKKAAWKAFNGTGCQLLNGLGQSPLTPSSKANAEKFLVQLYKLGKDVSSGDEARHQLFGVMKKPEALPPTSDALQLHILRCHYQVNVWENAHHARPVVMDPESCGWRLHKDQYIPILMTLEPIPKACTDIVTCNCSSQCLTTMCTCMRNGLTCTKLCHRSRQCLNALNS